MRNAEKNLRGRVYEANELVELLDFKTIKLEFNKEGIANKITGIEKLIEASKEH